MNIFSALREKGERGASYIVVRRALRRALGFPLEKPEPISSFQ